MKSASILLALVVVLAFARPAGALYYEESNQEFTIKIAQLTFGFEDGTAICLDEVPYSRIYLGPFGTLASPVTAMQGLIGFCSILATLIIVPAVLTVRWKKKRASHVE